MSNRPKDDFLSWVKTARQGKTLVYYQGSLMGDRLSISRDGRYVSLYWVDDLATVAWDAYKMGLVSLVQRRNTDGTYDYIAQRTGKRVPRQGEGHTGGGYLFRPSRKLRRGPDDGSPGDL